MDNLKQHSFKIQIGTAIAVLLFIISSVWSTANYKAKIELAMNSCMEHYMRNEESIYMLENKALERDLLLVELRVKLANIESLLQDIKLKVQ